MLLGSKLSQTAVPKITVLVETKDIFLSQDRISCLTAGPHTEEVELASSQGACCHKPQNTRGEHDRPLHLYGDPPHLGPPDGTALGPWAQQQMKEMFSF